MEFKAFPKIPRLFRDMTITEKIDGTNACVAIRRLQDEEECSPDAFEVKDESGFDTYYEVAAQSRNRIITPDDDNYGFARWVYDHAEELYETLGEGYHYGEWWGSGIQRGYGLKNGEKRFSLFNTSRWDYQQLTHIEGLTTVPEIYTGDFSEWAIENAITSLRRDGSYAAGGFMKPEGIVVYHQAARQPFKVLLDNDQLPKSCVA